jgi:hypothetical protein
VELSDYVEFVKASCQSALANGSGFDLLTSDRTKVTLDGKLTTKNKPIGVVRLIVDAALWESLKPEIMFLVHAWTSADRTLPDSKVEVNFHPKIV